MRGSRRWIAFTLVVTATAICGWTATNWKKFRPYDWQQVESPDAQFRVSFPGTPAGSQESKTAADGSKFVSNRLASSPAHGVIYLLSWWENPSQRSKSTDELFAEFRDCDIKAFHGKILSEKEINVQGHPAKDTAVLAGNGLIVENRVIRVDSRLYSLWVLDSSGHLDTGSIRKFFSSLSLH